MGIHLGWRFLYWNETWLLIETKSHETISWDDVLHHNSSVWIKLHITLEAITDITNLVWYFKSSLCDLFEDWIYGCPIFKWVAETWPGATTLQWRHNEGDSVSNRPRLDCLFNRLFKRRSKKASKLRVTGLCEGNPPVTGTFPSQMASNGGNVSIWWRHQG